MPQVFDLALQVFVEDNRRGMLGGIPTSSDTEAKSTEQHTTTGDDGENLFHGCQGNESSDRLQNRFNSFAAAASERACASLMSAWNCVRLMGANAFNLELTPAWR